MSTGATGEKVDCVSGSSKMLGPAILALQLQKCVGNRVDHIVNISNAIPDRFTSIPLSYPSYSDISPIIHMYRLFNLKPRSDLPARPHRDIRLRAAKTEEYCVIVNEQNAVVDAQPRSVTVRNRLLGRGAYVIVFDSRSNVLVSRRSPTKDCYPGLLDCVIAGVVRCSPESMEADSYEVTARREISEEIGVASPSRLRDLGVFRYQDSTCSVWGNLFSAQLSPEQAAAIKLVDGEVQWTKWVPLEVVQSILMSPEGSGRLVARQLGLSPSNQGSESDSLEFTPVGKHVLSLYLERRERDTA